MYALQFFLSQNLHVERYPCNMFTCVLVPLATAEVLVAFGISSFHLCDFLILNFEFVNSSPLLVDQ